jgi:hypothetical protein
MRLAPAVTLALVLTACGGGADSRAQTQAPANRGQIVIYTPAKGKTVSASTVTGKQLRAVLRVSGRAAPGQQLSLKGACGRYSCEGITFVNADGRFHTKMELIGRRSVKLTVGYADARSNETPASVAVRLKKATAPTQASPTRRPPESESTGGTAAPAGGNPYGGPRTMIVIGDSLAVAMAPYLRGALEDWPVYVDCCTGRFLSEGMEILAETDLPPGDEGRLAILAFSLGTNDGPQNVDGLELAVRESVSRLGANGCAVWATIARPALNGVSYKAMNQRLEALQADPVLAGRLIVVPWAREYARHKSWQRSDKVHTSSEGSAARAAMYADAARSCAAR